MPSQFKGSIGASQGALANTVADPKLASASPRPVLAPLVPQPNVQLVQTTGRVPVAATGTGSSATGAFPTSTEAQATAIDIPHVDAERDAKRIMTHRMPGTGSTMLTRFLAGSGSLKLAKIAAAAEARHAIAF